jgi:hypothetical protein
LRAKWTVLSLLARGIGLGVTSKCHGPLVFKT